MTRKILLQLVAILFLATAASTLADTVKIKSKPAFRNVKVTGFHRHRLVFRGVSQQYLRKPLEQVEWLAIDGLEQLNAAEKAAAVSHWRAATVGYEKTLDKAGPPWLRDLVRLRLLTAYDESGQFDRAISLYTTLLTRAARHADAQVPCRPGPVGSEVNRRARAALEAALGDSPSPAAATALRTTLLQLLIYEEVMPDPAMARPRLTRLPQTQPTPATEPVGILPAPSQREVLTPAAASRVSLPPDSFVLRAAQTAFQTGSCDRAARLLELSLPYLPSTDRPGWRLLLGRCRIELGRHAEAAADLLNLAETDPDPARATTALYYVGLAHERMGRGDVARSLYEEVQQRDDAPDEVKSLAREGLKRLGR